MAEIRFPDVHGSYESKLPIYFTVYLLTTAMTRTMTMEIWETKAGVKRQGQGA